MLGVSREELAKFANHRGRASQHSRYCSSEYSISLIALRYYYHLLFPSSKPEAQRGQVQAGIQDGSPYSQALTLIFSQEF